MNYRIYCWRKPVKQIQVLPVDLLSRYPASLQPSFLLVWCWNILSAAEATGLALVTWWRRQIQVRPQTINDHPQHPIREVTASGLNSPLMAVQSDFGDFTATRLGAYQTQQRSLQLLSPEAQDLQELTEGHIRLIEALLAEEEKLKRLSTRVGRLQSLIRAQEHLLAEVAFSEANRAESSQVPQETADSLVSIGTSSTNRGEVPNRPLYGRTRRIPRSRASRNRG
jgi:hypothetical protein